MKNRNKFIIAGVLFTSLNLGVNFYSQDFEQKSATELSQLMSIGMNLPDDIFFNTTKFSDYLRIVNQITGYDLYRDDEYVRVILFNLYQHRIEKSDAEVIKEILLKQSQPKYLDNNKLFDKINPFYMRRDLFVEGLQKQHKFIHNLLSDYDRNFEIIKDLRSINEGDRNVFYLLRHAKKAEQQKLWDKYGKEKYGEMINFI